MAVSARRAIRRATLFMLPSLILLLVLGTWQLQRRAEKHAVLAAIEANVTRPPATALDLSLQEFRRARLTGRLDGTRAVAVRNRLRDGVMGIDLIVPLVMPEGMVVLVDRGWRPAFERPEGGPVETTVEGMLRRPAEPSRFAPTNRPERGEWYRVDPATMAVAMEIPPQRLYPLYLREGVAAMPEIPDNHLQYAVTWYGFAATLVVIYGVFVRRVRREGEHA